MSFPSWDTFSIQDNMFRSMKRRFRSLDGRFGSIYRRFRSMSGQFCSMNRGFQLTCLHCTLKIHHNNEYRETRGTLSLRRNHYGSHFLPVLARRNHFGGGNFYGMTGHLWSKHCTETRDTRANLKLTPLGLGLVYVTWHPPL